MQAYGSPAINSRCPFSSLPLKASCSDCQRLIPLFHISSSATTAADDLLLTSLAEHQVWAAEREDITNLELPWGRRPRTSSPSIPVTVLVHSYSNMTETCEDLNRSWPFPFFVSTTCPTATDAETRVIVDRSRLRLVSEYHIRRLGCRYMTSKFVCQNHSWLVNQRSRYIFSITVTKYIYRRVKLKFWMIETRRMRRWILDRTLCQSSDKDSCRFAEMNWD